MTISVALADDQALVRMGLRVLIESEDDLTLAGEAENGREAVEPGPPDAGRTWC